MKTTQGKAVAAYRVLSQLATKEMNSLCAYKLFRLRKALAEIIDFQSERERQKIAELGGTVTDVGTIKLPEDAMRDYIAWHTQEDETECEIDREKTEVILRELPGITISDMEALDEFIIWKE